MENNPIKELEIIKDSLKELQPKLLKFGAMETEFKDFQKTVSEKQTELLNQFTDVEKSITQIVQTRDDNKNEIDDLKKSLITLQQKLNHKMGGDDKIEKLKFVIAKSFLKNAETKYPNYQQSNLYNELKNYTEKSYVKDAEPETPIDGSVLIRENFASEIITILTGKTVLREAGCRQVNLVNGNLTYPVQSSLIDDPDYIGFNEKAKSKKAPEVKDSVKLSAKQVGIKIPLNKDFLRWSAMNFISFVMDEMQRSFSLKIDNQMLYGIGSEDKIQGIIQQAKHKFDATKDSADYTFATIYKDLIKARAKLAEENVEVDNFVYLMNDITFFAIGAKLNSDGIQPNWVQELYKSQRFNATPILTSTTLNKDEIIGLNAGNVVIGDDFLFETLIDEYTKADKRQINLLAFSSHDIAVLRPEGLVRIADYTGLNLD